MQIEETGLPGLKVLTPARFGDARGFFSESWNRRRMQEHGIELVVSKNSGGTGAFAKLAAARRLGLPVLMIDRPVMPPRLEAHSVDEVMDWLAHASTDLGV